MRPPLLYTFLFGLALLYAPYARADFYIVVQAGNPQRGLTQAEATNFFMGRSRAFSDGSFALIFDLPRDDVRRTAFYKKVTGMSVAQVNSYWARLMFAGQRMPPQALPDEATMIDIVKHNPNAIGWLTSAPVDRALRTLLVIKEPL